MTAGCRMNVFKTFSIALQLHFQGCNNLEINGITSFDSPEKPYLNPRLQTSEITQIKVIAPNRASPNTDGIDISTSTDVEIYDIIVGTGTELDISPFRITKFPVSNRDDCVASNCGSININIKRMQCGPGHGIRYIFD
uniref:Polygalacturonase n=1 Tax=Brassica oleracea TaxID=3712 RepID=A0A3P6EDH8_BRAOL|nr:unnamed protein product [Brassica oleracea]